MIQFSLHSSYFTLLTSRFTLLASHFLLHGLGVPRHRRQQSRGRRAEQYRRGGGVEGFKYNSSTSPARSQHEAGPVVDKP